MKVEKRRNVCGKKKQKKGGDLRTHAGPIFVSHCQCCPPNFVSSFPLLLHACSCSCFCKTTKTQQTMPFLFTLIIYFYHIQVKTRVKTNSQNYFTFYFQKLFFLFFPQSNQKQIIFFTFFSHPDSNRELN